MSKFNYGDVVRLKPTAIGWGSTMTRKSFVVSDEKMHPNEDLSYTIRESVDSFPDDFELVEAAPEKHVHYDMIVEWAKDPSRVVQWRDNDDCVWTNCTDDKQHPYPLWDETLQYRFKPEEPERVFPVTSLTKDELRKLFDISDDSLFAIANAAIKQYILDQENS